MKSISFSAKKNVYFVIPVLCGKLGAIEKKSQYMWYDKYFFFFGYSDK